MKAIPPKFPRGRASFPEPHILTAEIAHALPAALEEIECVLACAGG
jgi:hypothetical protein